VLGLLNSEPLFVGQSTSLNVHHLPPAVKKLVVTCKGDATAFSTAKKAAGDNEGGDGAVHEDGKGTSPREGDLKKAKVVDQLVKDLPRAAMQVLGKADAVADTSDQEATFRLKARLIMEDFFMKRLTTMQLPGALFLGSMLALELEEELCRKCSAGSALNRSEYGRQQLKLMRNLKQSHNEQLVRSSLLDDVWMDRLRWQ
jgi:hypothetical protein